MKVVQTNRFKKSVKRLHPTEKKSLDKAVSTIIENPLIGTQKVADLSEVRVYKFKIKNQLTLLGYNFNTTKQTITLLALGHHENFYRDLKR